MDEIDIEYQKYLAKLEILKVHNNLDPVSTFFLNTWKRKFQEIKDKEFKKLSFDEINSKILEEEKGKANKNLNEHIFLEYFQYKYEKHCEKIIIADELSRTSIFNDFKKQKEANIFNQSSKIFNIFRTNFWN